MSLFFGRRCLLQRIMSPLLRDLDKCGQQKNNPFLLQYHVYYLCLKSCHSKTQPGKIVKNWTPDIVNGILEKLRSEDKTFYSVSLKEAVEKVRFLSNAKVPHDRIEFLLNEAPHFLQGRNMEPVVKVLQDHGFKGPHICDILISFGSITKEDPSELSALLMFLRKIYRTDRKFIKAITSSPGILSVIPDKINARLKTLQELFKSDDVLELTIKSPQIIFEDFETIQDKFDYVFHTMGISQRQMVFSNMFNYSLRHIQTRHAFLERAGFFKKIKKDKGEINTNPLLQDIVGLSDKTFARKFGDMTEQDYQTFAKYFALEIENME